MNIKFFHKLFDKWLDAISHIRYDNGLDNTPALLHMMAHMHSKEFQAAIAPPSRRITRPGDTTNIPMHPGISK